MLNYSLLWCEPRDSSLFLRLDLTNNLKWFSFCLDLNSREQFSQVQSESHSYLFFQGDSADIPLLLCL